MRDRDQAKFDRQRNKHTRNKVSGTGRVADQSESQTKRLRSSLCTDDLEKNEQCSDEADRLTVVIDGKRRRVQVALKKTDDVITMDDKAL